VPLSQDEIPFKVTFDATGEKSEWLEERRVVGTQVGALDSSDLVNALRQALRLDAPTTTPVMLVYAPHAMCAFVYAGDGDVCDPAVMRAFMDEYLAGGVTPTLELGPQMEQWRAESGAGSKARRRWKRARMTWKEAARAMVAATPQAIDGETSASTPPPV